MNHFILNNMAFTEQEKQLIAWGRANGKSKEDVKQAIIKLRSGVKPEEKPMPEPSYVERVGKQYQEGAESIISEVQRPDQLATEGKSPLEVGVALAETGVNVPGEVAKRAFAPITEAATPLIKPMIENLMKIPGAEDVVRSMTSWAEQNPRASKILESVFNLATLGIGGAVERSVKEVAGQGLKVAKEVGEEVLETGAKVARGAKETAEATLGDVTRIPSRIATNVAEKKAIMQTIKELPSEVAQKAAQDGVDVADIKTLYSLPQEAKSQVKELADTVRQFARGETKTNPIEIVGRPIIQRLKSLESARTKVGKQLGEIADNLGVVTREELLTPVFDALQSVPGLSGLTVDANGILNFSKTTLATSLTKSDRKAIQQIFSQATKWGNGKQKHLLRQELFEILGGKKRSFQTLTDTQEKAFDAVRKGLSNVLEAKNEGYKALSNEYRKIVQPLADMRKFMKGVAGADEDILDMSAGLLARRITSNAPSNPQLRNILRSLDEAIPGGATEMSVETLQDFYNILDKYYDIAAKTGFKGQIKSAIESPSGISSKIVQKVGELTGETPAVRQKAIEDILNEILK